MSIEAQWMIILGIVVLMFGHWLGKGKPNGTEIFLSLLSMLSPLEYLDKAAFRISEIAEDESQTPLKRNTARIVRYVGLKLLFLVVIAGVVFVFYGRAIARVFRWY